MSSLTQNSNRCKPVLQCVWCWASCYRAIHVRSSSVSTIRRIRCPRQSPRGRILDYTIPYDYDRYPENTKDKGATYQTSDFPPVTAVPFADCKSTHSCPPLASWIAAFEQNDIRTFRQFPRVVRREVINDLFEQSSMLSDVVWLCCQDSTRIKVYKQATKQANR